MHNLFTVHSSVTGIVNQSKNRILLDTNKSHEKMKHNILHNNQEIKERHGSDIQPQGVYDDVVEGYKQNISESQLMDMMIALPTEFHTHSVLTQSTVKTTQLFILSSRCYTMSSPYAGLQF